MAGQTPVIDNVVEKIKDNRPLVGAIIEGLRAAAQRSDTSMKPSDVAVVHEEVVEALARDPIVQSQTNAEPWYKNRVKIGLYFVGLGAVIKLLNPDLSVWWVEHQETITNIIIASGATVAAIGEWLSHWLAGIDWKRPWTIIGIGRQA